MKERTRERKEKTAGRHQVPIDRRQKSGVSTQLDTPLYLTASRHPDTLVLSLSTDSPVPCYPTRYVSTTP